MTRARCASLRPLTRAEAELVLQCVSHPTHPLELYDDFACTEAKVWLWGNATRTKPRRDWVHWLGLALCQADILEYPHIDPADVYGDSSTDPETGLPGYPCSWFLNGEGYTVWDTALYLNVEWYWPLDLLLWGCRQWLKRHPYPRRRDS